MVELKNKRYENAIVETQIAFMSLYELLKDKDIINEEEFNRYTSMTADKFKEEESKKNERK